MINHVSYCILINILFGYGASGTISFQGDGVHDGGCDFPGNDLYQYQSTLVRCVRDCGVIARCTHFVFRDNDRTCLLKEGPVPLDKVVLLNNRATYCGIKHVSDMNKGIPTPEYGVSTAQYWDCGQPSCDSVGMVLGSNNYVKGCCKDDLDDLGEQIHTNSCKNSNMFICDKYQSWAVNDSLAYGFASVTLYPIRDFTDCCACYQLQFINESLQGKSMIVQVIDGQSTIYHMSLMVDGILYQDLDYSFNLLIPGGRSKQPGNCKYNWNGLGKEWYPISTGVSSREKCSYLPKSLQQGCLFRFDWLKHVEFPHVNYTKVQCPKELTDISGCSQGKFVY